MERGSLVLRTAAFFLLWTIAGATLSACDAKSAPKEEVLVFAAASMKPALDELSAKFTAALDAKMTVTYAASSMLAQQIQSGAPADVFISADAEWAAKVEKSGHAVKRADLLGNSLVLVVPVGGVAIVKGPEDLIGEAINHVAIGDPATVPAGKYAKEALETLGLWTRLQAKLVPAMDVRQALLYVERGEAEAGIVYATDAKSSHAVRVVAALDASLKTPIRYSLVLVKREAPSAKAEACFAFLLSDVAMRGFEAAGFTRMPEPVVPAAGGK